LDEPLKPEPKPEPIKIEEFDWFNYDCTAPEKPFVPEFIHIAGEKISIEERKLRMLRQLANACLACSMCELGLKRAEKNQVQRDPHVLSNMKVSKFMVVMGGGSRWVELCERKPRLDDKITTELVKHNLSEDVFYVCRIARCYNGDAEHFAKCSAFLQMEFNLIRPLLVIVFHEPAFAFLCPGGSFTKFAITKSNFGVNVLPVSSLDKIKLLSGLIRRLQPKTGLIPKQT
jgi:hypothetical protein